MIKPTGYDKSGVPTYDRQIAIADFWSALQTGCISGQKVTIGASSPADIRGFMGSQPDAETVDDALKISRLEYGALAFAFDEKRVLAGVYFGGDTGESLPQGIEQAAALTDAFGDAQRSSDIWVGPEIAIRFKGWPATHFATLPRFITCLPADFALSLSAMPMRKSISIAAGHDSRRLHAEFILKSFKFDYGETFHIDYCLHTLSVTRQS